MMLDASIESGQTIDRGLVHEFGYVAPQRAADTFVRKVPDRTLPILDVGCGTSLVGQLLHQAGYERIDAIDLSSEIPEKASSLQIYQDLWEGGLTGDIKIRPI